MSSKIPTVRVCVKVDLCFNVPITKEEACDTSRPDHAEHNPYLCTIQTVKEKARLYVNQWIEDHLSLHEGGIYVNDMETVNGYIYIPYQEYNEGVPHERLVEVLDMDDYINQVADGEEG